MCRKGKSAVERDPRKVVMKLKQKESLMKGMGLEIGLIEINRKEETCMFGRIERKTSILRSALQSTYTSLSNLQQGPRRGGPNGQIVSIRRAADGRSQRSRKVIDEKRVKCRAKNVFLWNPSTDSKRGTFVILKKHPYQKEKIKSNE